MIKTNQGLSLGRGKNLGTKLGIATARNSWFARDVTKNLKSKILTL